MPEGRPAPLVVIIENDRRTAGVLALLLEDWGFAAVQAASAETAMRQLSGRLADVKAIITDYHLDDGFTGIRGAATLAQAVGRAVPTIVTTGHMVRGEHADVFPVLSKPFDPLLLHGWLVEQVELADASQAAASGYRQS